MTEQPQSAPLLEERPIWKLDPGEQRVLLITFVGGVASFVVGAAIVGMAIAFARDYRHPNSPQAAALSYVIHHYFAVAMILSGLTVGAFIAAEHASPDYPPAARALRRVGSGLIVVTGLAYVLLALTGIGMAAGVH